MVNWRHHPAGDLTAKQLGYTDSPAPEEIAGWRGRMLKKDGDTTVIYTNIEDEVPTALDGIYARASKLPGAPQTYTVTVQRMGDAGHYQLGGRKESRHE